MNTSNVASSSTMVVSSKSNGRVAELQKQRMQLTKQIEKTNASTGDAKTKAETVKGINDKIAELDKQIQQAQIEEQQKMREKIQQKNAEKTEQQQYNNADESEKNGVLLSASLNDLLAAKSNHKQVNTMSQIRTKLQGEINVAEGQVKHGVGGSSIKSQTDVISKDGDALSGLDGKIGKKIREVKKHIDQSLKTGIAEAEKAQENKFNKADGVDGEKANTQEETVVDASNGAGAEQKIDQENKHKTEQIDILA